MKVKKLVELLGHMNPEATIKLHDKKGEELLFVLCEENNKKTVWLETESDSNMKDEIMFRFSTAITESDELDTYMEMLETGITVDMVKKYIGSEAGECMERFCKEHGLID